MLSRIESAKRRLRTLLMILPELIEAWPFDPGPIIVQTKCRPRLLQECLENQ